MNLNIPVSDQDEHKVPGDFDNLLGSTAVSSANLPTDSSKALATGGNNKSKLLLGLLGVFVILFVVIIVSISNSTNSLGEEITSTAVTDTETGLAPNFFAASITNPANESPPSLDGIDALFGAASEIEANDNDTSDDAPAVEDEIPDVRTVEIEDEDEEDDFDAEDFDWGTTVNQGDGYDPQAELERLLGSSTTTTTDNQSYTVPDYDMGLNSNTMAETMMSGAVEGETGPGLLLLLVPNVLYGVSWLRKSRKDKM